MRAKILFSPSIKNPYRIDFLSIYSIGITDNLFLHNEEIEYR